MLDDTLVVWTTEFGRMPTFQKEPPVATITQGLYREDGRRRTSRHSAMERRDVWIPGGDRHGRRTTSTPRSSICSASPTND